MKTLLTAALVVALIALANACRTASPATANPQSVPRTTAPQAKAVINPLPVIHVFVALCDNVNQGIVPVSASLGDGDNPATNLYWGAAFGVKTFFSKSKDWELIADFPNPQPGILERCVFKRRDRDVLIIADAYRGKEIPQAIWDFLDAASGSPGKVVEIKQGSRTLKFNGGGSAELLVYVGHDGLMDFNLPPAPEPKDDRRRKAIILSCASKKYFAKLLQRTGATPLLWTTNLMAPEAYILAGALDGWLKNESDEEIRLRAVQNYNKYQNCGLKSANSLFATGW